MNRLLHKALELASSIQSNKYRLAAIVTDKRGNILSWGVNSFSKTHTQQAFFAEKVGKYHHIFVHAEIHALSKVPYGKKPYAIYVARVGNNGDQRLAKPCCICQEAINQSQIKKVYYTKG